MDQVVERRSAQPTAAASLGVSELSERALARLPAEHGLTPEARARRGFLAHIMATSAQPASARRHRLHLITQYARAAPEASARVSQAKSALAENDLRAVDTLLPVTSYPWQREGFAYWSDRNPETAGARLVELLPEQPNTLRRYTPDERPVVFFFSGNRQAYVGAEHEPASGFFGQDLQARASKYVAQCGRAVLRMLQQTALRDAKLVMPVYGALRSRHEQRLVHFALSQDPAFVHPSLRETADALFDALRAACAQRGFRAVTHSYGSSAVVQCLTHLRERIQAHDALARDVARGVCLQFGGYRLHDLPDDLAPHHHCVLSPLDEIALGSAGTEPRYTSPVQWPEHIWSSFGRDELAAMVRGDFERVPVSRTKIKPSVDLWCHVLEGMRAYDSAGKPIAVLEKANGHFLSGYTEAAAQRVPPFLEAFSQ